MTLSLTAAYWSVLVAALLPIFWIGVAKWGPHYDNADPRREGLYQGFRKRAHDAQLNAFEALPFFIGAVVLAIQLGGSRGPWLDLLCVMWLGLRIAHGAAYLANRPIARSSVWMLALIVNIGIFLTPVYA
jgi:uncharacterized MAPEG superfamily protein